MNAMALKIMKLNPCLEPFASDISLRMSNFISTKDALLKNGTTLADFANGHHFYGFHRTEEGWFYREWAPACGATLLPSLEVRHSWIPARKPSPEVSFRL